MAVATKDKLVTLEELKAFKDWGEQYFTASSFADLDAKVAAVSGDVVYTALVAGTVTDSPTGGNSRWMVHGFKNATNLYAFQDASTFVSGKIFRRIKSGTSTWDNWETIFGGTDAAAVRTALSAIGGTYSDYLPTFVAKNVSFSSSSTATLPGLGLVSNSGKYLIAFMPNVTLQGAATLWAVTVLSNGYSITQLGGGTTGVAALIGTDGVVKNGYGSNIYTRCFSLRII